MYEVSVLRQAKKIVADDTHILHADFNVTVRQTIEDSDM